MTGSNRRPPACKAGALPAELIPHFDLSWNDTLVGLVGLEPTTPALSTRCSNQLSYRPFTQGAGSGRRRCPALSRHGGALPAHFDMLRSTTQPIRVGARLRVPFVGSADSLPRSCMQDRWRQIALPFSRKEVIQPHLPIRLPCYDFTPVTNPAVVIALLAVRLTTSGRTRSHGVTGGVYKTRERIHRGKLIRDY